MKEKVIAICGPTASGKTGLSIELAKKIGGEIISCDSMQIYQNMTIGTAKPTPDEMQGIQHYLIDFVPPNKRYSVADFQKDAMKAIQTVLSRGKVPIVVGGTGLYFSSLVDNIVYQEFEVDLQYRQKLEMIAKKEGLATLYQQAMKIDPEAAKKISSNDQKRILRILEIYHQTGRTKTEQEIESRKNEVPYQYLLFGIQIERPILYERINQRVDLMLEQGLIEEVKTLLQKYQEFPTALQGLGYKEVVEYFSGTVTKEEMIEKIKRETRRYAKRQLTCFRKNQAITWLDGLEPKEKNINLIMEEYGKSGEGANKNSDETTK
ncbi:MAG: tRNA (adenosine(37)-N6)-dimethylallyltransferase MiaA [Clostridia bacterium]|nr:tRNA (adenosine(37)-N6)-dimethylallyltransferase MiaA [Clostridia bacterium]